MKNTANIVYWYGGDSAIPNDGGGQRVRAWQKTLSDIGFQSNIVGLSASSEPTNSNRVMSKAKRMFIPMPFSRDLPKLPQASLNVVTVPAVFMDAAQKIPRHALIFDWMDLWSENARNIGASSYLSRPGGIIQSKLWKHREKALTTAPMFNTFAGYADLKEVAGQTSNLGTWLPNPIEGGRHVNSALSKPKQIRKIGFIGNFSYPPNLLSLRAYLRKYARHLEQRGLEIVVAGYGSEQVDTWGYNISVLGKVGDISDFYRSIDAAVVPIVHGGGIKVKAVEAMAHGVPLFATQHVVEGFDPSWRTYIGDVEDLLQPEIPLPSLVPSDAFAGRFSQDAFTREVQNAIADSGNRLN